jgi:hypothetical protein
MRQDMFCCIIFVFFAEGFELVAGFRGKRGTGPFALGFEEKSEGVSTDVKGIVDSILYTYRHMLVVFSAQSL